MLRVCARGLHCRSSAGRSNLTSDAHAAIEAAVKQKQNIPRTKFDPAKIYPSKAGSVRICNNTTRDAQQSNLSAEMAAIHRMQIATLIDDCYKDISGPPGVEQIWGGTIPMFDIWKRGVHPFDSLRDMTALLPHTPTSMLVRSNSLNSMNSQPKDVVDNFVKMSVNAGINVFTNFDANNDPRNHRAVAESIHKYGQHYQAALSWAVLHTDPSIYNVKWAVNWFKGIVKDLAPHSLYVKDPSGVLTPEMAGLLAREIKAEFPNLPLIFHSHYQTGFAYAAYLEAMRNGANGVECSLGFPDGAGQPYSLSMLRMVEDYGLETGRPDKAKWHAVNMLCKNVLRPLYTAANVVRTPDIQVEQTGIAGGQRSILDKELIDAGQAHLIPRVDEMVQQVRREGGSVCQVTPAADSYAREAMRRIRGGSSTSGFAPGYAQILYGENGSTKEPVNADQRRAALDERAAKRINELVATGVLTPETARALQGGPAPKNQDPTIQPPPTPLQLWRSKMDELAAPVIASQRRVEVESRIGELEAISRQADLLKSLDIKIAMAQSNAKPGSIEAKVANTADRIDVLKAELATIPPVNETATQTYHDVLLGNAPDSTYTEFINLSPDSINQQRNGGLTIATVKDILRHSGTITCSSSLLLSNSLESSARELAAFEEQHCLGLLDSPLKAEENTLLWSCFSKAAIPNLLQNFFLAYYTGDLGGFFPKLYRGDKEDGKSLTRLTLKKRLEKEASKNTFLYRNVHKIVERILKGIPDSSTIVARIKESQQTAQALEYRLERWNDPHSEVSKHIANETKERLNAKIVALRSEAQSAQDGLVTSIETYLRQHPNTFQTSYPTYDQQAGGITFAPEAQTQQIQIKIAKEALNQIIHHKQ